MQRTRHASLDYTWSSRAPASAVPSNQDEEWCEYLSTTMATLTTDDPPLPPPATGRRDKVASLDLTHSSSLAMLLGAAQEERSPSFSMEKKPRSESMCESLTSSTGSSPSGTTPWRPLGRRSSVHLTGSLDSRFDFEFSTSVSAAPTSTSSIATGATTATLASRSSFQEGILLSSHSSPTSSLADSSSSGDESPELEGPIRKEKNGNVTGRESSRPSIVDVDPGYAASCLPVLTGMPSPGVESKSTPLFHAKSPVLSSRKDSQTWQIQDEEFLTSPRLVAARHRGSDVVRGGLNLMPSNELSSDNQVNHDRESRNRGTKDARAASIDFSFQRTPDMNPPLPPPQEQYQRIRAKSFSFSPGYASSGFSSSVPMKQYGYPNGPASTEYRAMNHLAPPPPPPQQPMPPHSNGVRPPRVAIPNDAPLNYHPQCHPPLPYRRFSGEVFSGLSQVSESPNGNQENNPLRSGMNGRGVRSYSMECMNYGVNRSTRSQSIDNTMFPPPPPPQERPSMARPTQSTSSMDWPPAPSEMGPAPPLPPESRSASVTPKNSHPFIPVEAFYEVEFKRGRIEIFAGRSGHKEGEYVKVEADRGEDIGKIARCLIEKLHLHSAESSSSVALDELLSRLKRGDSSTKKILCVASQREREMLFEQRKEESEVFEVCKSKVRQRLLPMNVIDAEYQFDRHKLTFFFEADRRIDFRELVRDLFAIYKTRIWLQQVVPSSKKLCGECDPN